MDCPEDLAVSSLSDRDKMVLQLIEVMQPQTHVVVYRGVIYVDGTPLHSMRA